MINNRFNVVYHLLVIVKKKLKKYMATINYGKHNHIVTCIDNYFIECYDGIEAFTKGQWYLADKVTFGNTYQFKIYRGASFKTFNKEEFEKYFIQ